MLTQAQLDAFKRDGYLVLPGFASPDEVAALRQRVAQLVADFDVEQAPKFSTKEKVQVELSNDYFFNSASRVSCFMEEKAYDDDGNLRQSKERSINKIGHAMHDLDPVFRSFSRSAKVANVFSSLGYKEPTPVQSMYIFKQPTIGGRVVPHQDSSFLYTSPPSVIGLWWALEDASLANGCLHALPGSHLCGLHRRFVAENRKVSYDKPDVEHNLEDFIPLEVSAGTLVVLHGEVVHYSQENTSPKSREAYSVHFIEGSDDVEWAADNWLQRDSGLPFEPL